MVHRFILTVLVAAMFSGCAAQQPVAPQTQFDYSEHKPYIELGASGVKGQGFLRQQGGGVVTCAGSEVFMVPNTLYFRRAAQLYRSGAPLALPTILDVDYRPILKKTRCDAQGNFAFSELPAGTWLVLTAVNWVVAGRRQGGTLVRSVDLAAKETVQVLLTDNDFLGR